MLGEALTELGRKVSSHPVAALAIILLSVPVALNGASSMSFESGGSTFAGEDTQVYRSYEGYRDDFQRETLILLIESSDVVSPGELRAISRFDRTATGIEGIEEATTLGDLLAPGGDPPSLDGEIEQRLAAAPEEELSAVMPDGRRSLALLTLERGLSSDEEKEVYSRVEEAMKWSEFAPGTTTTLTGASVFGIQMKAAMQDDLKTMLGAAVLLMVVALGLLFRGASFRYLPLPVVLVSLFWTFGTMGYLGIPMTMASMAIFPILIGVGIDYAVHLHHRIEEEISKGSPRPVVEAYRGIGPAVSKALLTTSLGFTAMLFFPVPMVRGFGKMSLIGVVSAYLIVLTLIGPSYVLLSRHWPDLQPPLPLSKAAPSLPDTGKHLFDLDRTIQRIMTGSAARPLLVLSLATLLMFGGFLSSGKVGVQVEETELVPQDLPALLDMERTDRFVQGGNGVAVVLTGDVYDPATLKWMQDFQERAEEDSRILSSTSISSEIASLNGGEVPGDEGNVKDSIESIPPRSRERLISGGSRAAIELEYPASLDMRGFMGLVDALKRDLDWNPPPPGVEATVTGGDVLTMSAFQAIENGRTLLSLLAFGIILVGLSILFRSPVKASIPLIPIIFVVGWNGGAMYLSGTEYTPLTATLGALSIGLGADYSLLVMEGYLENREEGQAPMKSVETVASTIGRAITISALTTLLGFGALLAASFPLLQNFGKITMITIFLALTAAFVTLPPLLVLTDPWIGPDGRGILESLR